MLIFWNALRALSDGGRIAVAVAVTALALLTLGTVCGYAESYLPTKWIFGACIFGAVAIAAGIMIFVDRLAAL
jgi:ABC-type transport system involved in cytochrome c biogenesis permease subunit